VFVGFRLLEKNTPEPEGIVVNAVRPNVFAAADLTGWADDPIGTCERLFPGNRDLLEKYEIDLRRTPSVVDPLGATDIDYAPKHHFGTFLRQLRGLDERGAGADIACPY